MDPHYKEISELSEETTNPTKSGQKVLHKGTHTDGT